MNQLRLLAGVFGLAIAFSMVSVAQETKKEAPKDPAKKEAPKKEAPKSVPTVPFERKDAGAVNLHKSFVERAKKGDVQVLFLGDSITQGWSGNGKKVWASKFEPMKAANFGIGGDRTEHVLWRLTEGKELEGISPKVCVLMIGTNNAGSNSAEEIAAGVKADVAELRKQRPDMKILLLGVFPRAVNKKEDTVATKAQLNPKIGQINAIISKLDDGKHIKYLDIGPKFLTEKGDLEKTIMYDFLHLTEKGYEIWAEAIKEPLAELLK